jgi:hypothetical protein
MRHLSFGCYGSLLNPEKLLKVPQSGTFNNFSGFYKSAKRCKYSEDRLLRLLALCCYDFKVFSLLV